MVRSSVRTSGRIGNRGRALNPARAASTPSSGASRKGTASSTFCKMVSMAGTRRSYAPWLGRLWGAAAVAGAPYGIFLLAAALVSPAGADLTGRFPGQPVAKALMAALLAAAALWHPVRRE